MIRRPVSLSEPAFVVNANRVALSAAWIFYLWDSQAMKALKSQLASELLADPKARDQLRQFMTSGRDTAHTLRQAAAGDFKIHRDGGQAVRVMIVPKAKAA